MDVWQFEIALHLVREGNSPILLNERDAVDSEGQDHGHVLLPKIPPVEKVASLGSAWVGHKFVGKVR